MNIVAFVGYLLFSVIIFKNVEAANPIEQYISTKILTDAVECIQSNPLTFAEIKSLKDKSVPEGLNPKCFIACVYKKIGIINEMGMLSPAGARKKAEVVFKGNEEQLKNVDELMQSCLHVNDQRTMDGSKGCDRAKLVFICLSKNGPKYGFDFL